MPEGSPATEAELRVCTLLADLVAAAWPHAAQAQSSGEHVWEDFQPDLTDAVHGEKSELPPAALALALRVWGRMHGLVALEVYGHLRSQVVEVGQALPRGTPRSHRFAGVAGADGERCRRLIRSDRSASILMILVGVDADRL